MFLALVLGMVFDQGILIFWVGGILAAMGIVLIIMAIRKTGSKALKAFLFITGGSAAGIVVFALLHNLIYALLVASGVNIQDEAVFFILATIVCPLALIAGLAGSFIHLHRQGITT